MFRFGNRIIVCGGGIGGLTFVIALDKYCREAKIAMPEVIVLEKVWDRSKKMRDTYSLSLRSDTGASDALKELDLLESVNALRSADYPTLTGFIMATSSNGQPLNILAEMATDPQSARRVPRCDLWSLLLDRVLAIKGVEVHFGCDVCGVDNVETAPFVRTVDGRMFNADLIVVADGNRSAVRGILAPNEKLMFQGAVICALFVELKLPPVIATRYGIVAGDHGSALFICPERHGTLLVGFSHAVASEEQAHKIAADPSLLEVVKNRIKRDFGPPFDEVENAIKPDTEVKTVVTYDKPAHSSIHRAVFLGDATHPVTPFSGNGAGMAIIDAKCLAQLLVNSKSSLSDTVREFDADVKRRSERSIFEGRRNIAAIHTTDPWTIWQRNFIWRAIGFAIHHSTFVKCTAAISVVAIAVGVGAIVKKFWDK